MQFPIARGRAECGASAVEYGLLVAAIAAVIVATVFVLGGLVEDKYGAACSNLDAQVHTGASC